MLALSPLGFHRDQHLLCPLQLRRQLGGLLGLVGQLALILIGCAAQAHLETLARFHTLLQIKAQSRYFLHKLVKLLVFEGQILFEFKLDSLKLLIEIGL